MKIKWGKNVNLLTIHHTSDLDVHYTDMQKCWYLLFEILFTKVNIEYFLYHKLEEFFG